MALYLRRSLTVLILILFSFSLLLIRAETGISSPLSNTTPKSMEVIHYPPYADRPTDYTFTFLIDRPYGAFSWIEILFPPGTYLHTPLPEDSKALKEKLRIIHGSILTSLNMSVNFNTSPISLPELAYLEDGRLKLRFQISENLGLESFLSKYRTVHLGISRRLGFCTPKEGRDISYSLHIGASDDIFTSAPQSLPLLPTEEDLSLHAQMDVSPQIPDAVADYRIKVHLQDMHPFRSIVSIVFPEGTTFEPPLPERGDERTQRIWKIAGYIYQANPFLHCHCGGSDCFMLGFNINAYQQQHRINFPMLQIINPDKELWKEIEIVIPKEAGIKTPSTSGPHQYKLHTMIEPFWKISPGIELTP